MRSIARHSSLVLIAFVLACLASSPGFAAEGRHPKTGVPAYTFTLPVGWSALDGPEGNLFLASSDRSTVVVILNVPFTGSLEKFAMDAFTVSKSVPSDRAPEATEISGFKGATWFASITRPDGLALKIEMSVVRIDAGHVASASLILAPSTTAEQVAATRLVRAALKLVTE